MKTLFLVLFVVVMFVGCMVYPVGYRQVYYAAPAPVTVQAPVAMAQQQVVYTQPQTVYYAQPTYAYPPLIYPYFPQWGFGVRIGGRGHHR